MLQFSVTIDKKKYLAQVLLALLPFIGNESADFLVEGSWAEERRGRFTSVFRHLKTCYVEVTWNFSLFAPRPRTRDYRSTEANVSLMKERDI